MIAKNHEPKPSSLQVVNGEQLEHVDLGEAFVEESKPIFDKVTHLLEV